MTVSVVWNEYPVSSNVWCKNSPLQLFPSVGFGHCCQFNNNIDRDHRKSSMQENLSYFIFHFHPLIVTSDWRHSFLRLKPPIESSDWNVSVDSDVWTKQSSEQLFRSCGSAGNNLCIYTVRFGRWKCCKTWDEWFRVSDRIKLVCCLYIYVVPANSLSLSLSVVISIYSLIT